MHTVKKLRGVKKLLNRVLHTPFIACKIATLLLKIHCLSYRSLGSFASAAEGGLHPKHRLIKYHQFFIDHTIEGENILDIGCGNGALLRDVVIKTKAAAVGVELSDGNVRSAKKRLMAFPSVEIIQKDIWAFSSNRYFDAIILSNVLEHLDNRVTLLKNLVRDFRPNKILLRVPMFEREWLVPYKKELGIEWRLDSTHRIEYTEEEFRDELERAGLDIQKLIFRWGEMYAVAVPTAQNSEGIR